MDPPEWNTLDGQIALVSGANRGLGAQVAVELASLGCTVYAGARRPEQLEGLGDLSDGRIRPVSLDVLDETSIQAAVAHAVRESGRLDILVNNAAIGDWHGSVLHTLETERLDKVLGTNLRGAMLLAKHALPHLLERRGGRIVNVSSGMGGLQGMGGGSPAYRISKAAINGLTAYLHGEYGPRGLLANSVCPGWVRTDMGGQNAPRSLEQGADGITWLCTFQDGAPAGLFWRDREPIGF